MMVRPQFRINSQINEEAELQLPQMKCQTLLHKVDKVDKVDKLDKVEKVDRWSFPSPSNDTKIICVENHELVFAQLQGTS